MLSLRQFPNADRIHAVLPGSQKDLLPRKLSLIIRKLIQAGQQPLIRPSANREPLPVGVQDHGTFLDPSPFLLRSGRNRILYTGLFGFAK